MKIYLPTIVCLENYHYFDDMVETLYELGIRGVKFKELGCRHDYYAIFYTGKFAGSKAEKMAKQWLKDYPEDEE